MNNDASHFPVLSYLVGVFFIVLVVVFFIMVCVLIIMLNHSTDFLGKDFSIYNFQTLIAGILALFGAGLTVWMIGKQIRQVDKQANDIRTRKSKAARATMPFALATVTRYAEAYAEYAHALFSEARNQPTRERPDFPIIPQEVVYALKDCIEYSSRGWDKPIAGLLYDLQVAQTRLQRALQQSGLPLNFSSVHFANDRKRDAASLYAKAERLLPYARQEEDLPSNMKPEGESNLFQLRPDLRIRE